MASAARSLRLACRSCRSQTPIRSAGPTRVFVAWKSVGGGSFKEVKEADNEGEKPTPFDHWEREFQEMDRRYRDMKPSDIARDLVSAEERALLGDLTADLAEIGDIEIRKGQDVARDQSRPLRALVKPKRDAFWDEDEDDLDLVSNDDSEEFDENDMTDIAHAKLEEHREQRAYARIAIWEMPLLAKFAKPFEPPALDQPLRFRYTSYMGEYHPAEKKVVVEFSPADFGLTQVQEMKLKKLAGPRYNPEKDIIKMSCESFEHQAQNKRYLAELVEKLVVEAKDPTDTFEDIPLDLRHHKFKVKPKFPKEWRLSEDRMKELASYRQKAALLDQTKKQEGTLVDGIQTIQRALNSRRPREPVAERVALPGQRSTRGPLRL